MFELSAAFLIFILGASTLKTPHLVEKRRKSFRAADASLTILINALLAIAVYYVWWHQSHTELRLIFTIILWAVFAFAAISNVARINKPMEVISGEKAAIIVTVQVVLLGLVMYLVAT